MIYTAPSNVSSPRDFISNVQVFFDGGANSFSLARVEWEGTSRIAVRWNIARREWDTPEKISNQRVCVGMPSSHGYPVWFILPDEILDRDSKIWKKINEEICY